MKKLAFVVALMLSVAQAHAYKPIVQPRILHGVFCNTPEQMKSVLDNMELGSQSIAMVNAKEVVCVFHDTSAVLVSEMTFIRSDVFDGLKLWLYKSQG